MPKKINKLKYSVNENPPLYLCLSQAFIHVLIIFDGIIFIPNVLGKMAGLDADTLQFVTFGTIIIAAITTFVQSRHRFRLGAGFIMFCGSYSGFLACSLDAAHMGGMSLLATMTLLTVPLVFLYTYFIRFFRHIITPAVGGVVILLIAISFVPIGLDLWTGDPGASTLEVTARFSTGGVTILCLTLLMLFGTTTLKLWSPLLALAAGYAVAAATGQLHLTHSAQAAWFGLPPLAWPGIELQLSSAHIPLLLAFGMGMTASMIESTGNFMLVQQVSRRDFRRISYDRIQGGLYCDGLSKVASGLLGTAVPSTYCDNLPLIEMTGVASRRVGQAGAAILLVLAFMPKAGGFMLDMPGPIIGGMLMVVAAMLFHAGFGLVAMNRLDNQNGLILGLSLTVGLVAESGAFFPALMPASLAPMLHNSIAMGGFTALALSTLAHLAPKKSVQGVIKAQADHFPEVNAMISSARGKLDLDDETFHSLTLCCEEVFLYMVGKEQKKEKEEKEEQAEDRNLSIRISRQERGVFTEVVCGHRMHNIANFVMPDSLLTAKPEELDNLGLMLFSQFATDVKHVEISGYSFISFLV